MSWRWCLHEALPYAHQTNMSWKHSPTHGLTAFKGKAKKKIWNEQRKLWKNAKKHTVCEHNRTQHRHTPCITSYIYTKTTTDFFSTTLCGWNGLYKSGFTLLVFEANQSNRTNLFYNLRLFEPEIFLSRQAPKIVLMIFLDFCSKGAW